MIFLWYSSKEKVTRCRSHWGGWKCGFNFTCSASLGVWMAWQLRLCLSIIQFWPLVTSACSSSFLRGKFFLFFVFRAFAGRYFSLFSQFSYQHSHTHAHLYTQHTDTTQRAICDAIGGCCTDLFWLLGFLRFALWMRLFCFKIAQKTKRNTRRGPVCLGFLATT